MNNLREGSHWLAPDTVDKVALAIQLTGMTDAALHRASWRLRPKTPIFFGTQIRSIGERSVFSCECQIRFGFQTFESSPMESLKVTRLFGGRSMIFVRWIRGAVSLCPLGPHRQRLEYVGQRADPHGNTFALYEWKSDLRTPNLLGGFLLRCSRR